MMLRSQKIPARIIRGYKGGTFNTVGRYYLVQERNAHSWVEAWIDGRHILRRSRVVMDIPTGSLALTMDMRMDFFDFGARPRIELPDPASVHDATPTLERELDAAG